MLNKQVVENQYRPIITFDSTIDEWCISGKSYRESNFEVFDALLQWLNEENFTNYKTFTIKFCFEFISTSSMKLIFELLKEIKRITVIHPGKVNVVWCYEKDDEDIKDSGESLMELLKFPFDLVEI